MAHLILSLYCLTVTCLVSPVPPANGPGASIRRRRSLGTSFASAGLFTPVLATRAAGCSLRLAENCGRRTLRTRASVFRRKEPAYSCARPHTGIAFTHESWSAEPDRAPLGFRFRLLRPPRERRDRCRLVPDA